MKRIVVCGDSFNIGIGCRDLATEPYGRLLANHYDAELINLAKGSSSNYSVFLQAKYAAEELNPDLVLVSLTSYDRTNFFPNENSPPEINAWDVNYHAYPPYGDGTYLPDQIIPHPFKRDARYTGKMLTDQFGAFFDYEENGHKVGNYYARFKKVARHKLKALRDYFVDAYDPQIKRDYDLAVFAWAHLILKTRDIPHLIMCNDERLNVSIPDENLLNHSWFKLAEKYPDDLPSMHTSPEGHRITFEQVKEKIDKEGFL